MLPVDAENPLCSISVLLVYPVKTGVVPNTQRIQQGSIALYGNIWVLPLTTFVCLLSLRLLGNLTRTLAGTGYAPRCQQGRELYRLSNFVTTQQQFRVFGLTNLHQNAPDVLPIQPFVSRR